MITCYNEGQTHDHLFGIVRVRSLGILNVGDEQPRRVCASAVVWVAYFQSGYTLLLDKSPQGMEAECL